MHSFHNFKHFS